MIQNTMFNKSRHNSFWTPTKDMSVCGCRINIVVTTQFVKTILANWSSTLSTNNSRVLMKIDLLVYFFSNFDSNSYSYSVCIDVTNDRNFAGDNNLILFSG